MKKKVRKNNYKITCKLIVKWTSTRIKAIIVEKHKNQNSKKYIYKKTSNLIITHKGIISSIKMIKKLKWEN